MIKPPIAILSDFGAGSHHVGMMKGVILKVNPEAQILDVSHDILPFNVIQASYMLNSAIHYFPSPTIFLAVVDPGVGSARRPIIAVGEQHYYVCPDNGIISKVIESDSITEVFHIEEEHYFMPNICATFHGRDVFAPCAAWLSKQLGAGRFGDAIEDYMTLSYPKIKVIAERTLSIPIMYIDHFGNMVTSFDLEYLQRARERFPGDTLMVKVGETMIKSLSSHYFDAAQPGDPVTYFGSLNLLEVGLREANAAEHFGMKPGDTISVYLGE